jgi:hypothetical protein
MELTTISLVNPSKALLPFPPHLPTTDLKSLFLLKNSLFVKM